MNDCSEKGRYHIGEKNGAARLTWKKVKEIRQLYRDPQFTQTKLGKMFGVASNTIFAVVHNHTWKVKRLDGSRYKVRSYNFR